MSARSKTGYLLEDFKIFYNADRNMKTIPLHFHDFHKIVILLAGNIRYVIEGQSYDLLPGDIVLVRAGAMHRPLIQDRSLYERIIIYLSPQLRVPGPAGKDASLPEERGISCADLFEDPACPADLIRPGQAAAPDFSVLFSQLRHLGAGDAKGQPYAGALYRRLKVIELMILLKRCLREGGDPARFAVSADPMTADIMACISRNLPDPALCVDMIAQQVNLNRSYLMHYFKQQTGYTIGSYITEKRLFLARSLIQQGKSITNVCYDCGFGSYSSFYRAYVKKYARSPAEGTRPVKMEAGVESAE